MAESSDQPTFSVLIPTYNHAGYVGQALDSLIAQTDPDWEAVVVNDGSTDNTAEVLDGYAAQDARIRVFHKENGGAGSALNIGLHEARGRWVCWLSSDDQFEPRKFEIHREWFEKRPDCRFFFTRFRDMDSDTGEITDVDDWRPIPEPRLQVLDMLVGNYINGVTMCIRRSVFDESGPFNEVFRYSQDFDILLRALMAAEACYIPERTAIMRRHDQQASNVNRYGCFYDCAKSAIELLNQHPFEKWVPLFDLADPNQAAEALEAAFNVAARRNGFLYAMGEHRALVSRIVEWVWQTCRGENAAALRDYFVLRAKTACRSYEGTSFGLLWKSVLAAVTHTRQALPFTPLRVADIAARRYGQCVREGSEEPVPLREYIARFEGVEFPDPPGEQHALKGCEVVVVTPIDCILTDPPRGAFKMTLETSLYLASVGAHVLLVGRSPWLLGNVGSLPFLGTSDQLGTQRAVRALGEMDTLVGVARADILAHGRFRRSIVYHHNPTYFPGGVSPRTINRLGTTVICVSQNSRALMRGRGIRADRVHVVPNCMDRVLCLSGKSAGERRRHSLLCVGSIAPYKRPDRALQAFRLLRERHPDVVLRFYGRNMAEWSTGVEHLLDDGWIAPDGCLDWAAVSRDLPGVRYCGEVPQGDLSQAYHSHSMLILPSDGDDFPLVSLEAQACGCVPVLPRHSGIHETVRDGETGFVYEPNTPEALAETIERLWQEGLPAERQRQAAREWVDGTFSWERTGRAFADTIAAAPCTTVSRRLFRGAYRLHRRLVNKWQRVRERDA
jgi:glycosyltransferase involved in cell wall biosynthesis